MSDTYDRRFWSKSCSQNSKGCMPPYYIYANGTQCTHYIQTYLAGLADYNFSYYHMFLLRQFDPSRDNDIKTKVRMTHFEFVTFLVCFLSMLCNFLHKLNFVNIFP